MRLNLNKSTYVLTFVVSIFLSTVLLAEKKKDKKIEENPDVTGNYPGGIELLNSYLADNLHYPLSALNDTTEGSVIIGFIVEKDGRATNFYIKQNIGSGCGIEAARLLKKVPYWNPGMKGKKKVRTYWEAKVLFKIPDDHVFTEKVKSSTKDDDLISEDVMPEYPGGFAAFGKFLSENMRYPEMAIENNIQGKVYVKFVVSKDGSIDRISIVKGIGGGCDLEAARIIADCPNWIPGEQNGKPVNVWYTIPMHFQLH